MKKIFIVILGCLVLLAWPAYPQASSGKTEDCQVLKVIDGDTINILYQGEKECIRLLRIDTPERDEEGYLQAKKALEKLIGDRKVRLEFETPGEIERGVYGRILAYVWIGNMNINVEMVRLGLSQFWTKYGEGKYADEFREAERQAGKHYPKDILGPSATKNFYIYAYDATARDFSNTRNFCIYAYDAINHDFNISQYRVTNSSPSDESDNSNSKAVNKNFTMPVMPSALTFTGSGVDITKIFYCGGDLLIFHVAYNGNEYFSVWLREAKTGKLKKLLVNHIGVFSGNIPANPPEGNYFLEIGADGNWTIEVTGDVSLW